MASKQQPYWRRSRALTQLGRALRSYHRGGVAPPWQPMSALVSAERAKYARVLLDHGSRGC
ncbi:hypothetical protein [Streptomyces sp. NPDC049040]|uniref:hypothetical protein n=1 Tax=Streptomyces sp. NPDC049040 TaxID=3365593 RepID=UPI00371357E1